MIYPDQSLGALPHEQSDEPIIAYRAWSLHSTRLCSVAQQAAAWPRLRPMRAQCIVHGPATEYHDAPNENCHCGLYAMRTPEALLQTLHYNPAVVGRVALWGKVIVHETGYRAEYAYPQVLYYGDQDAKQTVREVAARYGCDATPLPDVVRKEMELWIHPREGATPYTLYQNIMNAPVTNPPAAQQPWQAAQISVGVNGPQVTTMTYAAYCAMLGNAGHVTGTQPQTVQKLYITQSPNVTSTASWSIPLWPKLGKKKKS